MNIDSVSMLFAHKKITSLGWKFRDHKHGPSYYKDKAYLDFDLFREEVYHYSTFKGKIIPLGMNVELLNISVEYLKECIKYFRTKDTHKYCHLAKFNEYMAAIVDNDVDKAERLEKELNLQLEDMDSQDGLSFGKPTNSDYREE